MINFLLQLNLRRIKRYFSKKPTAKIITAGLFFVVFTAVAVGIYQFFIHGFLYLKDYPYFKAALMLYSFEIFFLLIGFLVWLGSMISFLFSLFKNQRSNFILASPKFSTVPIYSVYSSLLSSMWILLFVLVPALWAGAVVFHTGVLAFILALIASAMVIKFSVLLAYLCVLGFAYLLNLVSKSGVKFKHLGIALSIVVVLMFGLVAAKVSHHDIIIILSSADLKLTEAPLEPVLSSFKYLPTSTAAQAVTFTQVGQISNAITRLILLAVMILGEIILGWFLGKKFLPLWQSLSEGAGVANTSSSMTHKVSTPPILNSPFGAVLFKEKIQLFRNPKNSFWLMFLLVLWLGYIGFTLNIQRHLTRTNDQLTQLPNIILSVQLLILVYFISALVLRFVFPSFSAERNTAWIFVSSPLRLGKLLWAKFWFFASIFCGFTLIAQLVNVLLLKLPIAQAGLFLLLGLTSTLALSALGLYFGTRFANFDTDDPQSLGTSIPGLVFILAAVLYGSLSAYSYYNFLISQLLILPIIFILASLLLTFLLVASAASRINHTDFAPQYE